MNILDVSKYAIIKRKNTISYEYFEQLNNDLLDYGYINCGKKISRNDNYCLALINTLFNVGRELPNQLLEL
jgi:hypothetical protein